MQITNCLLLLFNQSGAESCKIVSSLSAYDDHLYFDLELFESDLPLQFLSYLVVINVNTVFGHVDEVTGFQHLSFDSLP